MALIIKCREFQSIIVLHCTLGDRFLGGLFDLSLLKTLLSSLVKHVFTNINHFPFFSNVCMRAFSPLHFLGKPVADFVFFFVDIDGLD